MRTLANIALSLLLIAILLGCGCLACSQDFQTHKCCDPQGRCSKTPSVQALALPGAANGAAPAVVAEEPAAPPPPPVQLIANFSRGPLVLESPPDLCKLHSVFRK